MRNMRSVLRLLFVIAGAIACVQSVGAAGNNDGRYRHEKRRAGVVLYQFKTDLTPEQRAAVAGTLQLFKARVERNLRDGATVQTRFQLPKGVAEEQLVDLLLQSGALKWAEPDYEVQALAVPNDPYYTQQWWLPGVQATAAWDVTTGSSNILVAVCDTGVATTHPDLAPNLELPGYNTYLNNTYVTDTVGHGTMVAGIIGAVGDNGAGVASVGWKTRILPIRITYADGVGSAYLSDMAEGLTYAADRGAKVVNCSFSGYNSSTIETAAKYARGKGTVVCFAAGNSGVDMTVGYPDSTNIVVVGATSAQETLTSWSNYGKPVDIVAPGENILSTANTGDYGLASGTSFASPIIAGVAALVFSVNPGLSPADVEKALVMTAKDLGAAGDDSVYGAGLVQAGSAVAYGVNLVAAPVGLAASVSSKTVTLRWTNKANNATGLVVERAPSTKSGVGTYAVVATLASTAQNFSQTVASGSYSYRLRAVNGASGQVSAYTAAVNVTVR